VTSTTEVTQAYNELLQKLQTDGADIKDEDIIKIIQSIKEHHKRELLFLESSKLILIEMVERHADTIDIANRMINTIHRLLLSGSDFSE
jgi:hypothetical protein